MPIQICDLHGRTGAVTVCEHLLEAIQQREQSRKVIHATFNLGNFGENPRYPIIESLRYCTDCVSQYDFPSEDGDFSEDKYEQMVEQPFGAVCFECFKSWALGEQISPD